MKTRYKLAFLAVALILFACTRQPTTYTLMSNIELDQNRNSTAFDVGYAKTAAIQCQQDDTGSPVGNMNVQGSLDNSNWDNTAESAWAVSGDTGHLWSIGDVGYNYIRLAYTSTSGGTSSDCDCTLMIKE